MEPRPVPASRQFGQQAAFYARSQVHASRETLDILVEWAQPRPTDRCLDIGTGVGFTAFALALRVAAVVAYDPTWEMLQQGRLLRSERRLPNVTFVQGMAEQLAFPSETFDRLMCRTAAHHFLSVPAALAEARRVLRPGGRVLIADTVATEDEEADQWQDRIERLRDPSHIRDYTPSEWRRMLQDAKLEVQATSLELRTDLTFYDWAERSGTSAGAVQELRRLFAEAPRAAVEAFRITPTGDDIAFSWPVLVVRAVQD